VTLAGVNPTSKKVPLTLRGLAIYTFVSSLHPLRLVRCCDNSPNIWYQIVARHSKYVSPNFLQKLVANIYIRKGQIEGLAQNQISTRHLDRTVFCKKDAPLKIALWQTMPLHDPQLALAALDQTAQLARTKGADLIVTPEMTLGGYNVGPDRCKTLAASSEAFVEALKRIAKKHEIALVVGLALPGGKSPYNGVIVLDAAGVELHRYYKTHLYGDVDRSQFAAGTGLSGVFDLNGWSIGLAICYDIEFPEVARALALQGADLILVPTANMIPFDSVATRLVPARAEENAVYLAYANYVGTEGAFTYGGLSCICGPDGNDLVRARQNAPELLLADLNQTDLATRRKLQNHLTDRRPTLYERSNAKGPSDA